MLDLKPIFEKPKECDLDYTVYIEGISSDIEVNEFKNQTVHLYRTEDYTNYKGVTK